MFSLTRIRIRIRRVFLGVGVGVCHRSWATVQIGSSCHGHKDCAGFWKITTGASLMDCYIIFHYFSLEINSLSLFGRVLYLGRFITSDLTSFFCFFFNVSSFSVVSTLCFDLMKCTKTIKMSWSFIFRCVLLLSHMQLDSLNNPHNAISTAKIQAKQV